MGLTKLENFWTAKEAINKKTSYELGENICKQCDWQRLNFQNIQMLLQLNIHKNMNKKTTNKNTQTQSMNVQKTKINISPKKT